VTEENFLLVARIEKKGKKVDGECEIKGDMKDD
jgi:hypothetical protein